MRILHLIYSLNVGGAERMVITLANYQVQSNQVGLCIINNLYSQKLLNELDSRIQVFRINRKKASRNILDVFQLNRYVFKFRPDNRCNDHHVVWHHMAAPRIYFISMIRMLSFIYPFALFTIRY